MLVAGFNPVAVDCAATRLMGFDPMRVPSLREAFAASELPLVDFNYAGLEIRSNDPRWHKPVNALQQADCLGYRAHFGWRGAIEWRADSDSSSVASASAH